MTTTITATVEASAVPPRVRLNVTTDQSVLTLYRIAPDNTRTPIRSYEGDSFVMAGTTMVVYDPEAPFGVAARYTSSDPAATVTSAVTVPTVKPWLVHPALPALSMPVTIQKVGARQRAANASVRYPLGASMPIVVHDGRRKAATFTLDLLTQTLAEATSLELLTADLSALLLNVNPLNAWGLEAQWVHVGDLPVERPNRMLYELHRQWSLPCTVVRRPQGAVRPPVTYGDSFARYPTYGDRFAAHATYGPANDPANY